MVRRRGSETLVAPGGQVGGGERLGLLPLFLQANMIHFDRTMYIMSLISLHFLLLYPKMFQTIM